MKLRHIFLLSVLSLASTACQPVLLSLLPAGAELFRDDFAAPESGWAQANLPEGEMAYQDGALQIAVREPDAVLWSYPGLSFVDAVIEVDARKLAGGDDNLFGVLCRRSGAGDFYAFLISSDGYYGIARAEEGQLTLLGKGMLQPSEAIQQGASSNHLTATCRQEQLSLAVNGQTLLELQVDFYPAGDIGLIAGANAPSGATIAFDDLVVRRP